MLIWEYFIFFYKANLKIKNTWPVLKKWKTAVQEHIVFSYMKNPDLRTGGVLKSGEKRKREHITSGLVCFPDADIAGSCGDRHLSGPVS